MSLSSFLLLFTICQSAISKLQHFSPIQTLSRHSCENIEFQREGYVVRSSRVDDPFDFLPWIKLKVERVKAEIAALVDGKQFRYDTAIGKALEIIEDARFFPEANDAPLKFAVEIVSVENCADGKLA